MNTETLMPFNLEEALKNPERVVYGNGKKPLEWHFIKSATPNCKIVTVDSSRDILTHSELGRFSVRGVDSSFDLFLAFVTEKRYWLNIYEGVNEPFVSKAFKSEQDAYVEMELPMKLIKRISFTV